MRNHWPSLSYEDWKETYQTLHRWTQIVGKLRLCKTEWINHSWNSTLYVTPVGMTTSPFRDGDRSVSVDFDFSSQQLIFLTSEGDKVSFALQNESVASFFERFRGALKYLKIEADFEPHPNELEDATPFVKDTAHTTYIPSQARNFWQVLVGADQVLKRFRSDFLGKCSPVHFFWGSFDLAVTRFSGRVAPVHPGGVPHLPDRVTREAYSHEVSSCGFWPGNEIYPHAAFYSYTYPEPKGFKDYHIEPEAAFYHDELREFILPYEDMRTSASPEEDIMRFLKSTYVAAAELGGWDRAALENGKFFLDVRRAWADRRAR